MVASSVTGKGVGSAEAYNKGTSDRQTLGHAHMVGPQLLLTGKITLSDGGTGTVVFPRDFGATANLVVSLTGDSTTVPYVGTLTTGSLAIIGGTDDVVSYMIMKAGIGV